MADWNPQANDIFLKALDTGSPGERLAFLDSACVGNSGLRAQVDSLLTASDQAGSFLDSPALELNATSAQPSSELLGTVGPYKLLQQIGEGGMGTVYMAEQTIPVQRKVALKIIKLGMDSRQVIARFEAERQALALMDHPNIAKMLEAGATDTGQPYFVMELVKGISITSYCDQHKLNTEQRLNLFLSVCSAVQHAHQKGIIHRDLKPNNVLVADYDDRPVAKIIDFGVAKAVGQPLTERTMFTEFGQVMGTIEYMSPEQAKLNQLDIDTRTDIYSLGVLLYELLAGSTPFDKERLRSAAFDEMLRIIREEEPVSPSTRLSTSLSLPSIAANRHLEPKKLTTLVRGDLDWIVMKALEKDRNRRYETATGLAQDIGHYLADEPVQACPPSASYRLCKFARRNKVPLTVGVGFLVLLVAATVVSGWLAVRARLAEEVAKTMLEEETAARALAVTATAKSTAVSNLLQEMLASANPDQSKGVDYTVRQLLDDFSLGLDEQLHGQPEVEAAVRATIGNAYRRLSLPNKAEQHLRRALEIRRAIAGTAPEARAAEESVADSLLDYGWNEFMAKRPAVAERYAREAVAIYRQTSVRDGRIIESLAFLQLCLNEQKRFIDANGVAEESLALGRQLFPEGHAELANILHRLADTKSWQGELTTAEALARQSVAMHERWHGNNHPETAYGLSALAKIEFKRNNYAEAEANFRRALSIFRTKFGDTHKNLVPVLEPLQQVLAARGDQAGLAALRADHASRLSRAIERDPSNFKLRIQLGDWLRQAGDLTGALSQYSDVIARNPDLAEAWCARGKLHVELTQWDKAADDFAKAIELNPNDWETFSARALSQCQQGHLENSVPDFSKAIELAPDVRVNWFDRGRTYLNLARWDKAAADFARVIDLWPDDWEGWYYRGAARANLADPRAALSDLHEAIDKGFRNVEQMKNDPTLAPLGSSEDFKKLLTELESATK